MTVKNNNKYDEKLAYLSEKINNNPIFYMKREEDPELYNILFDELYVNAYELCCHIYCKENFEENHIPDRNYGDFALELRETLVTCLEWYDPNVAQFTNFFNYSFARVYRRICVRKIRTDVNKDRAEEIRIRDYLKFLGLVFIDTEIRLCHIYEVAKKLNMDPEKVEKIILKKRERVVLPEVLRVSDDGEINLVDEVRPEMSVEDLYINFYEGPIEIIRCAQAVYDNIRETQREIVSLCFTADVCNGVDVGLLDIHGFEIISEEMVAAYLKHGKILEQKEIASMLGKEASAVCRVYSGFKARLKELLDKKGR